MTQYRKEITRQQLYTTFIVVVVVGYNALVFSANQSPREVEQLLLSSDDLKYQSVRVQTRLPNDAGHVTSPKSSSTIFSGGAERSQFHVILNVLVYGYKSKEFNIMSYNRLGFRIFFFC